MSQPTLVRVWALVFCVMLVGSGSIGVVSFFDTVAAAGNTSMSGSGTEADPYVVTDVDELQAIQNDLDAHYFLGNDINASATEGWNGGDGFDPIGVDGAEFTGTFDGQGYTISNLTIDRRSESYAGLFGDSAGTLSNVFLTDVAVTGDVSVGSLAGVNNGVVTRSSATGIVRGNSGVGGLVGDNDGTVTRSHSGVMVNRGSYIGGLVGINTGEVTESYATGAVSGSRIVGGLLGENRNNGEVMDSYATGAVSGSRVVGGLVGANEGRFVENSYATGPVSDSEYSGGFVGRNFVFTAVEDAYWDQEASGRSASVRGTGLTTAEMTGAAAERNMYFDFTNTWVATDSYPRLQWSVDSTTVTLESSTIDRGTTTPATVTFSFVDGSTVTATTVADYASNDTSVATIAADGTVTGVTHGTATLTATQVFSNTTQVVVLAPDIRTDTSTLAFGPVEVGSSPSETLRITNDGTEDLRLSTTSLGGTDASMFAVISGEVDSPLSLAPGETREVTVTFAPSAATGATTATLAVESNDPDQPTTTVSMTGDAQDTTAPTAVVGADVTVDEDTAVSFDGSASTDNSAVDSYEWEFGDGSTTTGKTATYTFADIGTYTVNLTVTDVNGNTAADSLVVTVADITQPTAVAGADVTVDEDTIVALDGSASTDNGALDSYEWEFGDGSTATGATVQHTFATPGTYTVNLTVTDANGNTANDSLVATVTDVTQPTAVAGPNRTVDEDTVVNFTAANSTDNGVIAQYAWEFGDGSTATGANVSHTYDRPGAYQANLTVTDAGGNDQTDSTTVTVRRVSSGGQSTDRCAAPNHKRSRLLEDGRATVETDCNIEAVGVTFDEDATGYVTVASADSMPRDIPNLPNATSLLYVDITVSAELEQSPATLRVRLKTASLGDATPDDLVVYHYTDGAWTALETSVVSTSDERVVVEAVTTGFSPFVVGSADARVSEQVTTTSQTETPTAEPTTTATATTPAPPTKTETSPPESATSETTSPGFGPLAVVVALVVAVIVAVRRIH